MHRIAAPTLDELLHVVGQRALKMKMFSGTWVLEAKHTGMQCLTRKSIDKCF